MDQQVEQQETLSDKILELRKRFQVDPNGQVQLPDVVDGPTGDRLKRVELGDEEIGTDELEKQDEIILVGYVDLRPGERTVHIVHLGKKVPQNYLQRAKVGERWTFREAQASETKDFRVCSASFDLDPYEPGEQRVAQYPVRVVGSKANDGRTVLPRGWKFIFDVGARTVQDSQTISAHGGLNSSNLPRMAGAEKLTVFPDPNLAFWQPYGLRLAGVYVKESSSLRVTPPSSGP